MDQFASPIKRRKQMEKKNDGLEEIKGMNVYQRINAVSSEVGKVKMTLDVSTGYGKSSYKAVSINDVVDSLTPLLCKYRLAVIPGEKEMLSEDRIEKVNQGGGTSNQFFIRMRAAYKVINIDKPEEFVETVGYGDGIDSGDKATGKAVTYCRKYALIDVFNLSKGDDPDTEPSPDEGYRKVENNKSAPKQSVNNQPKKLDQAGMAVEFNTLTRELNSLGVDTREEMVSSFIINKANVPSLDGGYLLTDLAGMARVLDVMRALIAAKKQKNEAQIQIH